MLLSLSCTVYVLPLYSQTDWDTGWLDCHGHYPLSGNYLF